jgi:ABC-type oligopeptide transport system ATPase subunit
MLLEVRNLKKHFPVGGGLLGSGGLVKAVDGVDFGVEPGKTFALVGESGCGKTTVAKLILLLERPTDGEILYRGENVSKLSGRALAPFRREVQAVFQDPYSSLNPRLRVRTIISEPIRAHERVSRAEIDKRVEEALEIVGLPASAASLYPHEFSGGQRQRISIARALATQPRFLICDEPTSALDVSIQAQILNILKDLQEHLNLTMLFISHDLPVVRQMCNRVGVLKGGRLLEVADTETLFAAPGHPYTRELLGLMPRLDGLSDEGWREAQAG